MPNSLYETKEKIVAPPRSELKAAAGPNCTKPRRREIMTDRTIPQIGSPSLTTVNQSENGIISSRPNERRIRETPMQFARGALLKMMRRMARKTVVAAREPVASRTI